MPVETIPQPPETVTQPSETQSPSPETELSPELQTMIFDVSGLTLNLDQTIKKREPFASSEQAFDPSSNKLLAEFDKNLARLFKIQFDHDQENQRYNNTGEKFSFSFYPEAASGDPAADLQLLSALKTLRQALGLYSLKATDPESNQSSKESERGGLARLLQLTKTFDQATSKFRDLGTGADFSDLRVHYYQENQRLHPRYQENDADKQTIAALWKSVSDLWKNDTVLVEAELQKIMDSQNGQLTNEQKAQYFFRAIDQVLGTHGMREVAPKTTPTAEPVKITDADAETETAVAKPAAEPTAEPAAPIPPTPEKTPPSLADRFVAVEEQRELIRRRGQAVFAQYRQKMLARLQGQNPSSLPSQAS